MNIYLNDKSIHILHLDDNVYELEKVKKSLQQGLGGLQTKLSSFIDPQEFSDYINNKNNLFDVALIDIDLESTIWNGINFIKPIKQTHPNAIIIILSQKDSIQNILKSLQNGADDFISKKSEGGELAFRILSSIELTQLKRGLHSTSSINATIITQRSLPQIKGKTMQKITKRIPRIINSAIRSIYVYGESGTGKEVVADILASFLPQNIPFVKVNCGAISETLLESELFGHIKGAFTGAVSDKTGLIEKASGGWIFLDEISTLTKAAQIALLRAIENQEIIKVGSSRVNKINVRFISASNENLEELVKKGIFRQDLWQRICETQIILPPLRERREEINDLVKLFCETMEGGPYSISKPALDILSTLSWKEGNIRQLRNCLRAMTEFHINKKLTPASIPPNILTELNTNTELSTTTLANTKNDQDLKTTMLSINFKNKTYAQICDTVLIHLIKWYVQEHKINSLRKLAKCIGIARNTLQQKLLFFVQNDLINTQDIQTILLKMNTDKIKDNSL